MGKYIALLRGINVGGKNKVSMAILKEAFEQDGFKDVSTYINSGNVIFSANDENESELKRRCESIIKNAFDLDIIVSIISDKDLSAALANAPDWWDADAESKHNAVFVIPPVTVHEIIEQAGLTKPQCEQVGFHGQVIFWSAPIKTFSRTRLSKFVSTNLYSNITVRNANTTKKLLQLIGTTT